MADQDSSQTPPSQDPVETGEGAPQPQADDAPPATPPKEEDGGATDSNDEITLKRDDYNKLVSQRDGNHERLRQTEAWALGEMQKQDIQEFLGSDDAKEKYPDVSVDDLREATSPAEFADLAQQTQDRIENAVQKRLNDIEKVQTPTLSPDERTEKEKALRDKPGKDSLVEYIGMQSTS